MKRILVFPTWVLVKMMTPLLPKQHAWKNKRFTLKDWADHSTELNELFSMIFWINALLIIIAIIKLK